VGQLPQHAVADHTRTAATEAPPIILNDPTRQHRTVGLDPLSRHLQAERVKARKRRQVRASEGAVGHVEVFRMGSVRASILGRPRPLPRQRGADHAAPLATLSIGKSPHSGTSKRPATRGLAGTRLPGRPRHLSLSAHLSAISTP